jgi:hypothetical protein
MLQLWDCKPTLVTMTSVTAIAILLTSYFGFAGTGQATEVRHPQTPHETGDGFVPTGKGWGERDPSGKQHELASKFSRTSNGISYHGGPLIIPPQQGNPPKQGPINVYYIWYGNWGANTANQILPNLVYGIGGSPYFNINTTYYNSSGLHVSNSVALAGQASDSSLGTSLSDSQVQAVVANAINSGKLPSDTNGVYFVLTAADVNETSGFCTSYCGWHTHGTINGADIKYAFVGNPDACPSACEAQTISSPNNNTGADGMASVIAHELEEATTDPDLNAWYDTRGYENADKCAWKFGTTSTASNGSQYNVTFSYGTLNLEYLIQMNWVNASGGYCSIKYP